MALGGGVSKHLGIGNQHARNVPTAKLGPVRALYQTRSGEFGMPDSARANPIPVCSHGAKS
jgi:hypothetical protein